MTVCSMTGFGRGQARLSDGLAAGVTVRSVNHRYLDVQVRLTVRDELPEVDAAVREEIERVVERGRITVQVSLQRLQPSESTVVVDRDGLSEVLQQLQGIGGFCCIGRPGGRSALLAGIGDGVLTVGIPDD